MVVPKLRFPLFTSNYSEVMLKDLLAETIKNGTQNKEGKNEHQIKFINVINLYSPLIKHSDLNFVDKDLKKIEHLLVRQGDLFFTRSSLTVGGIAHCNIYEDDYSPVTFDDHLMRVRVNIDKALPKYVQLASITPKSRKYLTRSAKTGTMTTIGQGELESFKLNLPTIDEQKKVVDFFDRINTKIALQKEKTDLLKEQKKGFLQKMFPQPNEKQPQMRFNGFTGDWKSCKLGDIVDFYSGLTYSPEDVLNNEGTLVLRSSNIKSGNVVNADNVYVDSNKVNSEKIIKNDIIVVVRNGSRNLIGKHAIVKNEMPNTVIGAFMTGIRAQSPNFINAMLDTNQFDIEISKNLGATINQITTGAFKSMLFSLPQKEEQDKIGQFFRKLDDSIEIQNQKLYLLQQQKQAFMQQMFI